VAGPLLYRGDVAALHLRDAAGAVTLDIGFDKPISTSLVDRWEDLVNVDPPFPLIRTIV
jgi:hypothetical protein